MSSFFKFYLVRALVAATAVLIALLLMYLSAEAHSWYEQQCCTDNHCHPVDDDVVIDGADGVHVKNFGVLSYSDARLRWSRDNGDHLCISNGKLICVYRRPKDM